MITKETFAKNVSLSCRVTLGTVLQQILNAGETAAKKKKYQHLDKRLHNLVSNPHQNIINQITALAHNIIL